MHGTTLDLASASPASEQLSHLLPLVYADLRPEHQRLVEKASGDGGFKACPPISNEVDSFVTLVKDRIDRQWNEYGGAPENRPEYLLRTAYLERNGSYSELRVYVEDLAISG